MFSQFYRFCLQLNSRLAGGSRSASPMNSPFPQSPRELSSRLSNVDMSIMSGRSRPRGRLGALSCCASSPLPCGPCVSIPQASVASLDRRLRPGFWLLACALRLPEGDCVQWEGGGLALPFTVPRRSRRHRLRAPCPLASWRPSTTHDCLRCAVLTTVPGNSARATGARSCRNSPFPRSMPR